MTTRNQASPESRAADSRPGSPVAPSRGITLSPGWGRLPDGSDGGAPGGEAGRGELERWPRLPFIIPADALEIRWSPSAFSEAAGRLTVSIAPSAEANPARLTSRRGRRFAWSVKCHDRKVKWRRGGSEEASQELPIVPESVTRLRRAGFRLVSHALASIACRDSRVIARLGLP